MAFPAEVLLKIFRAYVDANHSITPHGSTIDKDLLKPPLPVTYVCRTWRAYAIGDPSLWCRIYVTADDGMLSEITRLFLERSCPLPVDVSVHIEGYGPWEEIVVDLVKQKEVVRGKEVRFSDRVRGIRVRGLWSTDAQKLVNLLDEHELPILSEFSIHPKDNENRYSEHPFLPLIRPSITRNLDAGSLGKVITSCPFLETLVLGRMSLDVSPLSQPEGSPHPSSSRVFLAPKLKYLAVASPMTWMMGRKESCQPGCRCFFRDLVADNLQYIEVAGELLVPGRKEGVTAQDPPPLIVILNVGSSYLNQPEELLRSLPLNVSLHLFDNSFEPDPVMRVFFMKMRGVAIYRVDLRGSDDDASGSLDGGMEGALESEGGGSTVLTGMACEPPYLGADQDSDPELEYGGEDMQDWGYDSTDSEWDQYSSNRSFDSEY
ncbi:hypothetical protein FA13DRAFT_1729446 [Coprinellus micaceus]|uniref:Uncharacterized protein n=1 Tax=Coprinellus micaceus TaxID=71717 RepID=A0A4Y7TKT9_COPMI|nr:hypothetical protein FA13DRAFT_1729446 [Coprinellus micaceus]